MLSSKKILWYEVWVEDGVLPHAVLFLWANVDGTFEIYDPITEKIQFNTSEYGKAASWLWEDEYVQVDGRMEEDYLELYPL